MSFRWTCRVASAGRSATTAGRGRSISSDGLRGGQARAAQGWRAVALGCENGLDVVRVDMVAPIRVGGGDGQHPRAAFPNQHPMDMARRVQAVRGDGPLTLEALRVAPPLVVMFAFVRAKTGRSTRRPTWRRNKDLDVLGGDTAGWFEPTARMSDRAPGCRPWG